MGVGFGIPGFHTIENFYTSVEVHNPAMALIMFDDLKTVALGGISGDRDPAYLAVMRLRQRAQSLPISLSMILDHALQDLGYSLEHVEQVKQTRIAVTRARRSREIHTI